MKHSVQQILYEVVGLEKDYDGKRVLSIPHLTVSRGAVCCLYGENGSGKTTLFEILTLLQQPTRGKVFFSGSEVYPQGTGLARLRDRVTLVHQNPLLFDTTVERNVDYGLRVRKMSRAERKQRVKECLRAVTLDGFQKRSARELSGGEAQRVAIARALAIDPEVLLLDEFSANVDSENRKIIEKIIQTINSRYGTTIFFTTHYFDQAYRLADQVVHLYKGRIAAAHISNILRGVIQDTPDGPVFINERIRLHVVAPAQTPATISLPVTAITVSTHCLDSSMRNCLQGRISHIIDEGKLVVLRVQAGELFEAVITKESFQHFDLGPGCEVYLNFKASAVEVL
ncbi:ABC transporter ATP-binding protein [Thermodesulfobacteriota bacterium]